MNSQTNKLKKNSPPKKENNKQHNLEKYGFTNTNNINKSKLHHNDQNSKNIETNLEKCSNLDNFGFVYE